MRTIKIKSQELLCQKCHIKWLYSKEIVEHGCPQCANRVIEINLVKKAMTIWEIMMKQIRPAKAISMMINTYEHGWVSEKAFKKLFKTNRYQRLKDHWMETQGAVYEDVDGNYMIDVTKKESKKDEIEKNSRPGMHLTRTKMYFVTNDGIIRDLTGD